MHLSHIAKILLQMNNNYFSKTALVRFRYESVSLDANIVCFDDEQDISNTLEKSRKSQSVTEWSRCRKH